ncbi:MAG: hypothetical protein E8D44_07705 [Nitrospira sp.]|nr:MAG: hypothetical protein E8D44_07705 [Nitrospira sp.]
MKTEKLKSQVAWIQHTEVQSHLTSSDIHHPWFPAYMRIKTDDQLTTWFSALVPVDLIPGLVESDSWDLSLGGGHPSVWTHHESGNVEKHTYHSFGNKHGIEPLVICREFHGMREDFVEVAQEFRLYHNLYLDQPQKRFILFNEDGDDSEAVRYGQDFVEIRTDLLLQYSSVKQMAIAVFVQGSRYSKHTLEQLGLKETHSEVRGANHQFHVAVFPNESFFASAFSTLGTITGKKYILPSPMPTEERAHKFEHYQEFIIGADTHGKSIKHTCDPNRLANHFGKNPGSPHYLTPVFFRPGVLSKYYAEPQKYSVEDGYLRCGGLWGLQIDNDHSDYLAVYLGDLGQNLSGNERNYWLSFNIPPDGREISETNFRRSFMAEPTDPQRADLVFKHQYGRFREDFRQAAGWDFFLPLHQDDEHFLTGLRLMGKDNQAEFDAQLIALTKVLVDSINEKDIGKDLKTLAENDKGITKLEKYFRERGMVGLEPHIKFLRGLQDLRSKSAAHRKGSNYEKLIEDLQLTDEGQQRVFSALLTAATDFIQYLRTNLLSKASAPLAEEIS